MLGRLRSGLGPESSFTSVGWRAPISSVSSVAAGVIGIVWCGVVEGDHPDLPMCLRDVGCNAATVMGLAAGLRTTDVRALICLLDAGLAARPATPTWLREQLYLAASVTVLTDRMEKGGHVRR
jgi:hypothetical protein